MLNSVNFKINIILNFITFENSCGIEFIRGKNHKIEYSARINNALKTHFGHHLNNI